MDSLSPKKIDPEISNSRGAYQSRPDEVLPPLHANLNANPDPGSPSSANQLSGLPPVELADSPGAGRSGKERNSPLWTKRLSMLLSVTFSVELGLLLAVLPWFRVWTDNSFLVSHPAVRQIFENNFLRGAVTGLGLVDVWLGVSEAVHYRDNKP
jgi:hypothetical protein